MFQNEITRPINTEEDKSTENIHADCININDNGGEQCHVLVSKDLGGNKVEDSQLEIEENCEDSNLRMASSIGTQIRVLTLSDNDRKDSTLYRVQKKWVIQFRLDPSLFGRQVSLYCNYPDDAHETSVQNENGFNLLKWSQDGQCENADDTACYAQICVQIAGSYRYYFTYEDL